MAAGRRPSILEDWKAKFAGATPSDQRTMVVYRTEGGLSRTTAFKQTFGKITLPTGWSQQLQAKLQPVMKECFEVQILRLLEEQTGERTLCCVVLSAFSCQRGSQSQHAHVPPQ